MVPKRARPVALGAQTRRPVPPRRVPSRVDHAGARREPPMGASVGATLPGRRQALVRVGVAVDAPASRTCASSRARGARARTQARLPALGRAQIKGRRQRPVEPPDGPPSPSGASFGESSPAETPDLAAFPASSAELLVAIGL